MRESRHDWQGCRIRTIRRSRLSPLLLAARQGQRIVANALQFDRVSLRFPAGDSCRILFAWARISELGDPLAYSRVTRILCVVATDQRTDHRAVYRYQLHHSENPAAAERQQGSAWRFKS